MTPVSALCNPSIRDAPVRRARSAARWTGASATGAAATSVQHCDRLHLDEDVRLEEALHPDQRHRRQGLRDLQLLEHTGDARHEVAHLLRPPPGDEEAEAHDVREGRPDAGEASPGVAQRVRDLPAEVPRGDEASCRKPPSARPSSPRSPLTTANCSTRCSTSGRCRCWTPCVSATVDGIVVHGWDGDGELAWDRVAGADLADGGSWTNLRVLARPGHTPHWSRRRPRVLFAPGPGAPTSTSRCPPWTSIRTSSQGRSRSTRRPRRPGSRSPTGPRAAGSWCGCARSADARWGHVVLDTRRLTVARAIGASRRDRCSREPISNGPADLGVRRGPLGAHTSDPLREGAGGSRRRLW